VTFPVLLSACVAVLLLGLGVLLLAVARAPGWHNVRVFAVVSMSAAVYSASNITSAWFPLADDVRRVGMRVSLLSAAIFAAAWVLRAYGDRSRSLRLLPVWVRGWVIALVSSGVVAVVYPAAYLDPAFTELTVEWAHARYRFASLTPIGTALAFLYLASVALTSMRLLWRRRSRGRLRWDYATSFVVFLSACTIEVLVTTGAIAFPFVADVGFLALVLPMTAETIRRFVDTARELAESKTKLTEEVELRTHERDEAHTAWLEAERSAAIGRLAAGVGHEINNPLAYLRLNLELLGEWGRAHAVPAEFHESVESALDGADRIRRVIDALRAYSRLGTGEMAPVSLPDVTRATVGITAHQVRHCRPVERDLQPAPMVMGDEAKLVQVMTNLLCNAGQAIAEGDMGRPGVIQVRVGTASDGRAFIEVQDNGPGIPRDDLRRLTQPYFTTRAGAGAMGLGLFLARGVVEQHGGTLEIDSVRGEGTKVRVLLPPVGAPARRPGAGVSSLVVRTPSLSVPMTRIGATPAREQAAVG
jgi:signal transduction histidine kinase